MIDILLPAREKKPRVEMQGRVCAGKNERIDREAAAAGAGTLTARIRQASAGGERECSAARAPAGEGAMKEKEERRSRVCVRADTQREAPCRNGRVFACELCTAGAQEGCFSLCAIMEYYDRRD